MLRIRTRRAAWTLAATAALTVAATTAAYPVLADSGRTAAKAGSGTGSGAGSASGAAMSGMSGMSAMPAAATVTPDTSGTAVYLAASLIGRNEVPVAGKPKVGDPDGRAVELLRIQGNQVSFALSWKGIAAPTEAHVHLGAKGVNGKVEIALFATALPGSLNSVTGTVTVADRALLASLRSDPGAFYANIHTAEFPGGAVRGQLHRLTHSVEISPSSVSEASVVRGEQVYACTAQPGGGYAFTQHNVSALLGAGIRHSFVKADAGPPQWVAPDGSAVTGTVVSKTPNGQGDIPELDLTAARSGARSGLLADTDEVLRLNTVGGVAPSGSCDPHRTPIAEVPYQADYLFIDG
ncbi:hypothetical protein ABIA33_001581 [Streptacidiphilus sp. MAP12-16]|uniref:CHRD domain-containing protein n=1 Tax=Streptacidiphilus sp. MAP12-16 TaxID=3156300 RepID=UPI0035197B20